MKHASTMPVHQAFAQALFAPAPRTPPGLVAWNESDVAVRYGVYRNNVVASLVGVLGDTFPVVRQLVGDAFFRAAASRFIAECPPASPVMTEYGDGFADWLCAFEPAKPLPYLADMARLERARVAAFHSADAPPLPIEALARARADAEALPALRLHLHPSVTVLPSRYAVVSLWAAHQEADEHAVSRITLDVPETALVLRHGDVVLTLPLTPADGRLARRLQAGTPLGPALADAADADLPAVLALLVGHGAIVAVSTGHR